MAKQGDYVEYAGQLGIIVLTRSKPHEYVIWTVNADGASGMITAPRDLVKVLLTKGQVRKQHFKYTDYHNLDEFKGALND